MATSANSSQPPPITASQAVALSLLRHGFTERSIQMRTDVAPANLYRLAVLHDITAPHGTIEGYGCHEARGEDACLGCETAHGRAQARDLARQRKKAAPALVRGIRPRARLARQGGRSA